MIAVSFFTIALLCYKIFGHEQNLHLQVERSNYIATDSPLAKLDSITEFLLQFNTRRRTDENNVALANRFPSIGNIFGVNKADPQSTDNKRQFETEAYQSAASFVTQGYFYAEYYTGVACNGSYTNSEIIRINTCINTNTSSFKITKVADNCTTATFVQYSDQDCQTQSSSKSNFFDTCNKYSGTSDDYYLNSVQIQCQIGPNTTLPLVTTSAILSEYNTSTCGNIPAFSYAESIDFCFHDGQGNSYNFLCDNGNAVRFDFPQSLDCTGVHQVPTIYPVDCQSDFTQAYCSSPTPTVVAPGYFYLQFFTGVHCNESLVQSAGYAIGACINNGNGTSYKITNINAGCSSYTKIFYYDDNCQHIQKIETDTLIHSCLKINDDQSALMGCSFSPDLPVFQDSAILSIYNASVDCTGSMPPSFIAFPVGSCIVSDANSSFDFSCTAQGNAMITQYQGDTTCDSAKSSIVTTNQISKNCLVEEDDSYGISTTKHQQYQCILSEPLPTKSPSSADTNIGYVYLQYYSELNCEGQLSLTEAVSINTCVRKNETSFKVVEVSDNCTFFTYYKYSDPFCQEFDRQNFIGIQTACQPYSSSTEPYQKSLLTQCSFGTTSVLPIFTESAVHGSYNSTNQCVGSPITFKASPLEFCFPNGDDSYEYSCIGGEVTRFDYINSVNCQSYIQVPTVFTDGCLYSADDLAFVSDTCYIPANTVETGYFFSQYYDNPYCNGTVTFTEGVAINVCIQNNQTSAKIVDISGNCKTIARNSYSDPNCQNLIDTIFTSISKPCSEYSSSDEPSVQSKLITCSFGKDLPILENSVTISNFNSSDSTCALRSVPTFEAYPTNLCLQSDSNSSFEFSCNADTGIPVVTSFNGSSACNFGDAFSTNTSALNNICHADSTDHGELYSKFQCVITSLPTPAPTPMPSVGYVYVQYYTGNQCNGQLTQTEGVAINSCIRKNDTSTKIVQASSDCKTFTYYKYSDPFCEVFVDSTIRQISIPCQPFADGQPYQHSVLTQCSFGSSELPLFTESAVGSTYNSSSCDSNVVTFDAIPMAFCAPKGSADSTNFIGLDDKVVSVTFKDSLTCQSIVQTYDWTLSDSCTANEEGVYQKDFSFVPSTEQGGLVTGYIFFDYFSSFACNGTHSLTSGVALDTCVVRNGSSLKIVDQNADCSFLTEYIYGDEHCNNVIRSTNLAFSKCSVIQDSVDPALQSVLGRCSYGPDLPVFPNTTIMKTFNSSDSCNPVTPPEFVAFRNNVCFESDDSSNSYTFDCLANGNIITTEYINTLTCNPSAQSTVTTVLDSTCTYDSQYDSYFEYSCVLSSGYSPTSSPTSVPSKIPTAVPTLAPSINNLAPSAVPTVQTSPIASFSTNVTLSGLTSNSFDYNSQLSLLTATSQVMDVSISTLTFLTSTFQSTSSASSSSSEFTPASMYAETMNKLSKATKLSSYSRSNKNQKHSDTNRVLVTTYSSIATIGVSVPLSSTGYSSTTELYTNLNSLLTNSLNDGSYTGLVRSAAKSLGVSGLSNATVVGVTSSSLSSVDEPSSNKTKLGVGPKAGIIIGCILFVVFLKIGYDCLTRNNSKWSCYNLFPPRRDAAVDLTTNANKQDPALITENPLVISRENSITNRSSLTKLDLNSNNSNNNSNNNGGGLSPRNSTGAIQNPVGKKSLEDEMFDAEG
eukprot:gene5848-8069_t